MHQLHVAELHTLSRVCRALGRTDCASPSPTAHRGVCSSATFIDEENEAPGHCGLSEATWASKPAAKCVYTRSPSPAPS